MVDLAKAEELALKSWYMARIMTTLTENLAEECCLDEVYMIDLLAKYVRSLASDAHYEFIKD